MLNFKVWEHPLIPWLTCQTQRADVAPPQALQLHLHGFAGLYRQVHLWLRGSCLQLWCSGSSNALCLGHPHPGGSSITAASFCQGPQAIQHILWKEDEGGHALKALQSVHHGGATRIHCPESPTAGCEASDGLAGAAARAAKGSREWGLVPMVLKTSLHVSFYACDGEGSTDVPDVLSDSFMPLWRNRLFFYQQ